MRLTDVRSKIGREVVVQADGNYRRARISGLTERTERHRDRGYVTRRYVRVLPLDWETGVAEGPPFLIEAKLIRREWT
jgi:hypothetical protein